MHKQNLFRVFLFSLSFTIFSCQSQPAKVLTLGSAVLIESKALIKTKDDSNTVSIEIRRLDQRAIRMDITGTLGVSVASVLLTPHQISYLLYSSHEYVQGPFHEKTLYPIFKKNIDPLVFWRVIHDQTPASAELKCETDASQRPTVCTSADGTQIKWTYEEFPRKRIQITSGDFQMNWLFKDVTQMDSYQNETFVLKKPQGFKEIVIK